ncbi:hypothetical protein ACFRI7_37670 [Streptomyces sp. NPDC056716]|uniref:hypothetical protein n=1 Tax=unclassified Streptomyces TaxID=2593676 RepID=UPI00369A3C55
MDITVRPLARWARAEWGALYATVRAGLRRRGWRAVAMTLGAVLLSAVLHVVDQQSWGHDVVADVGAVRADEPLWLALLRTPLSLFVPALDLPVWGALAQILFMFGIAEICIGRGLTLAVAYAATLAGTLYARIGIAVGPGGPFGLPASDAQVLDTGPSAAVVGLAVYVAWRYRAYGTVALVIVALAGETLIKDNMAGKEHLAAIAVTLVLCALSALRQRRSGARAGSGSSGAPPIQS